MLVSPGYIASFSSSFPDLLFELNVTDSGYTNLSQDLILGGVTLSPTFRYEGRNATTASSIGCTPLFFNAEPHSTGKKFPLITAVSTYRQAIDVKNPKD